MEEKIYDYWVATLQNGYIGNIIALTEAAGGAKSLYSLFTRQNRGSDISKILDGIVDTNGKVMLTKTLREHIADKWKNIEDIKREYYLMLQKNITYVNHNESDFPVRLLNIPSPPYGLFVKGNLPDPNKKSVAIVGARECSEYGRVCAEYFGDRLSREDVQIISGMAWGIDGIAQMAAVLAGGKSFGVLGCGPDVIYPRKNTRLYEKLCENGNGIISEYAPGTNAESRFFPPRNRIISGLCDALLVIEARAKSGTLITVNMAIEQGKTVLSLPGRITDELSRGCLMLIEEGAIPAISIEQVLEELSSIGDGTAANIGKSNLKWNSANKNHEEKEKYVQMELKLAGGEDIKEGTEREVYECLSIDPVTVDDILEKVQLDISEVLVTLSRLEAGGHIREVSPGEFVARI